MLPPTERLDAHLVYAWCRHADDAIDHALASERRNALARLRSELTAIYASGPLDEPLWKALREVVDRCAIPQAHFETLLDGMEMDVVGTPYQTLDDLRLYCHRVAGVVGWLMVGVLGIAAPSALRSAAHLGIAMQLTNICRDVAEDWGMGRLYLPNQLLTTHGAKDLYLKLGSEFPTEHARAVADTVRELLGWADHHYRIGDEGLSALSARSAFAIRTARLVYAAIGDRVRAADCDVTRGRAFVPVWQKLGLLLRAGGESLVSLPARLRSPHVRVRINWTPKYPDDLLPW